MSDDERDHLIDRGLRAYMAQEPLPGLEGRVLQRARRKAPSTSWWWAVCSVAVCALLSYFVVPTLNRPVETPAIAPLARIEPLPLTLVPEPRPPALPHKRRITAAERALLQFAREHPEQAIEVFAKRTDPITIDPIEIAPIVIEQIENQEEKKK